ncbi:D-2-hydroxyacid dehydrogenase [Paenibacillus koleovorans]|uniref:D-2-hydroxyacid dehydrogenase n=1 Tax=Paenibacillus koleovorans TaxID=121608 RepID=UPI000FD6F502|nr:D-2-hydroxyacid dehydrogenase [Paenibacillus koleovorans]
MSEKRKGQILLLLALSESEKARILETAPGWELLDGRGGKTLEETAALLAEAEIAIGWRKQLELSLTPDSRLRWVQAWGAGVDSIDCKRFAEHGVLLTNASGVHAYPISETILGMMLAFARKLHLTTRNQAQANWQLVGPLGEIHGRTVGILGVGAIGEETARLCRAFGMTVLGVRRSGEPSPQVDEMYNLAGLPDVLRRSDYVVNTLPLTSETRQLIGREQFALMPDRAVYINIGRGATTDTEAMIEALASGRLGGAGLDVFEQEPLPASSPLWALDNVIVTPHNAGSTVHYQERALEVFLHNLRDYAAGREPSRNRVDLDRQY